MNTLTGVLVGAHFRPPAKLILECLPAGASLQLVAEPDNPYDPQAVQVFTNLGNVPASQHSRLEQDLPKYGWDLDEFLQRADTGETIHLGYIAASKNKILLELSDCVANSVFVAAQEQIQWCDCMITLGFTANGAPLVILRAPAPAEAS